MPSVLLSWASCVWEEGLSTIAPESVASHRPISARPCSRGHHARSPYVHLPHAHVLLAQASVGQVTMCVLLSLARHASCHRSVIVTSQKMLELVYGTWCWKVSGSGSPNLVTRSVWWFSSTLSECLKQPRVDLTLMDGRCCETGCRRHAMDERAHDCRWQMISGCEFCIPSLVGRRW